MAGSGGPQHLVKQEEGASHPPLAERSFREGETVWVEDGCKGVKYPATVLQDYESDRVRIKWTTLGTKEWVSRKKVSLVIDVSNEVETGTSRRRSARAPKKTNFFGREEEKPKKSGSSRVAKKKSSARGRKQPAKKTATRGNNVTMSRDSKLASTKMKKRARKTFSSAGQKRKACKLSDGDADSSGSTESREDESTSTCSSTSVSDGSAVLVSRSSRKVEKEEQQSTESPSDSDSVPSGVESVSSYQPESDSGCGSGRSRPRRQSVKQEVRRNHAVASMPLQQAVTQNENRNVAVKQEEGCEEPQPTEFKVGDTVFVVDGTQNVEYDAVVTGVGIGQLEVKWRMRGMKEWVAICRVRHVVDLASNDSNEGAPRRTTRSRKKTSFYHAVGAKDEKENRGKNNKGVAGKKTIRKHKTKKSKSDRGLSGKSSNVASRSTNVGNIRTSAQSRKCKAKGKEKSGEPELSERSQGSSSHPSNAARPSSTPLLDDSDSKSDSDFELLNSHPTFDRKPSVFPPLLRNTHEQNSPRKNLRKVLVAKKTAGLSPSSRKTAPKMSSFTGSSAEASSAACNAISAPNRGNGAVKRCRMSPATVSQQGSSTSQSIFSAKRSTTQGTPARNASASKSASLHSKENDDGWDSDVPFEYASPGTDPNYRIHHRVTSVEEFLGIQPKKTHSQHEDKCGASISGHFDSLGPERKFDKCWGSEDADGSVSYSQGRQSAETADSVDVTHILQDIDLEGLSTDQNRRQTADSKELATALPKADSCAPCT